jgi:hypothetical protein
VSNSIFEVNGKAYDSRSVALLGNATRTQPAMTVYPRPVRPSHQSSGVSMDGMVGPAQSKTAPRHVSAHQPQPTKTLMRQAVKAPQPGSLSAHRPLTVIAPPAAVAQRQLPQHPPVHQAAAPVTIAPKLSSSTIDPVRAQRARMAGRSTNVAHFRSGPQHAVPLQPQQQQVAHMPVVQPQAAQPQPHQPVAIAQHQPQQIHVQHPHPQAQAHTQSQPQPQQMQQQSMRSIAAARRPYAQPMQAVAQAQARPATHNEQQEEQDLFAQALAQAKSHEEPAHKESINKSVRRKGSKTRRIALIAGSLSLFVALSGFVAFQNRQQIQLQMASAKAGFAASTPLYMPQGYSLGNLSYASGSVATTFTNNGKPTFSITQKKSNWNSQTLLDNFVATSGDDYKGYQSNGRTVYIYGAGKATWVNGGIWYQIKGADKLSDEQLVKIATSM